MFSFLRQPYPNAQSLKRMVIGAFCVGVFISLFLMVFQPFGANTIPGHGFKYLILEGYGIITTFAVILCQLFLRMSFPKWMEEKSWTTGKEILVTSLIIFIVSLLNLAYTNFVFAKTFSWIQIPYWAGVTMVVGIFPVTFSVLLRQVKLKRETEVMAVQMNAEIDHRHETPLISEKRNSWKFISENEREFFETNEHDLLFVEAADNYSTFYFLENETVKKQMLRGSLKKMEEQVPHTSLFRCHRTYIANLSNVVSVSGNAQGYRLNFKQTDLTIPVSRNLGKGLKQKLHSKTE